MTTPAYFPQRPQTVPSKTAADRFTALAGFREASREDLIMLIEQMASDWCELNQIHNDRANRNSWCGEYEERQTQHNTKFAVLKLRGRSSSAFYGDQEARL